MALLSADTATDAARILDGADVPHGPIVSVDRDSILFRGQEGRRSSCVYTAWLNGEIVVMVEEGFAASEPIALHPAPGPESKNYGKTGGTV